MPASFSLGPRSVPSDLDVSRRDSPQDDIDQLVNDDYAMAEALPCSLGGVASVFWASSPMPARRIAVTMIHPIASPAAAIIASTSHAPDAKHIIINAAA